ncbi:hypothetical protein MRB53_015500 [Persea americana]|uniref:Uncharacterized protein n=1 Tax=Persea americana TaxID=3435 RepID=A0ACC2LZJ4_PERAE|nr:hypothetical protein MRB53_015500 [Persea americana]
MEEYVLLQRASINNPLPLASKDPTFLSRPLPHQILDGNQSQKQREAQKHHALFKLSSTLTPSPELIRRIEKMMAPGTGGLSGLFPLGDSYIVASTDRVGTKVELASETQIHDTIGIDLVATSVNDIVSFGAEPVYFRDYHVMCSYRPKIRVKVEKSISAGCSQSNCAIFGGKIEEMPGCHVEVEYCLGGFAVGKVKKDSLIDGKNIIAGDVLVGLPSNGVHCNGFSLVRRVLAQSGLSFKDQIPGGSGKPITLGEALMAPTVNYVQQVLHIIGEGEVKGIAHITSGGLTASIPRVFPRGLGAVIYQDSWEVPAVFKWIQEAGRIDGVEMRSTFNMGIGMVLVVSPDASARILGEPHEGYLAYRIGEVTGKEGVTYQ